MKLIRFGNPGFERPGLLLDDGTRIDASGFGSDYNEDFFESDGIGRLRNWASTQATTAPRLANAVRTGPPVVRPSKIVCIGLNYRDHAEESGMVAPEEPVVFFKATSSLCGPYDPLIIPRNSRKTDWEVELAVVIGKKARYVPEEEAMAHIAGYVLLNDYSEREDQLERGGQWVKGKSHDTFSPLGPFLLTSDEMDDPHNLNMWLSVNGEEKQRSNTGQLIFRLPLLISYLSRFMTLLAGDIISTGTPSGVGLGYDPPQYLKPGDVVELGIDRLGSSRQEAIAYKD
jgi:2-keto-4-pentenoate hydratase/2-oxohepta-3-ene-1,7-dioic acid hydratase in catechol pathway